MSKSKYHPSPAEVEALLADAAHFLAESMFELTTKYKGLEKEVAAMMVHQLGGYISICTKNPQEALVEAANALGNTNYGAIRAAHFGYQTLGVDGAKNLQKPTDNLVQMGDPRQQRRKTDD